MIIITKDKKEYIREYMRIDNNREKHKEYQRNYSRMRNKKKKVQKIISLLNYKIQQFRHSSKENILQLRLQCLTTQQIADFVGLSRNKEYKKSITHH